MNKSNGFIDIEVKSKFGLFLMALFAWGFLVSVAAITSFAAFTCARILVGNDVHLEWMLPMILAAMGVYILCLRRLRKSSAFVGNFCMRLFALAALNQEQLREASESYKLDVKSFNGFSGRIVPIIEAVNRQGRSLTQGDFLSHQIAVKRHMRRILFTQAQDSQEKQIAAYKESSSRRLLP